MTFRKRPRDPAQLAKLMIDIASGEVQDRPPTARYRFGKLVKSLKMLDLASFVAIQKSPLPTASDLVWALENLRFTRDRNALSTLRIDLGVRDYLIDVLRSRCTGP